jgi:hypothetical protein
MNVMTVLLASMVAGGKGGGVGSLMKKNRVGRPGEIRELDVVVGSRSFQRR